MPDVTEERRSSVKDALNTDASIAMYDGALGRAQGGHNALSAIDGQYRRNRVRQLWLKYAYY